jgi:hypothetical protein
MIFGAIIKAFLSGAFCLLFTLTRCQENTLSITKAQIANTIIDTVLSNYNIDRGKTRLLVQVDFQYDSVFVATGTMGKHLITGNIRFDSLYFKILRENNGKNIESYHVPFVEIIRYSSVLNPPFLVDDSLNKVYIQIDKPLLGWDNLYIYANCSASISHDTECFPYYHYTKIEIPVSFFYKTAKKAFYKIDLFEFEIANSKKFQIMFKGVKEISGYNL